MKTKAMALAEHGAQVGPTTQRRGKGTTQYNEAWRDMTLAGSRRSLAGLTRSGLARSDISTSQLTRTMKFAWTQLRLLRRSVGLMHVKLIMSRCWYLRKQVYKTRRAHSRSSHTCEPMLRHSPPPLSPFPSCGGLAQTFTRGSFSAALDNIKAHIMRTRVRRGGRPGRAS